MAPGSPLNLPLYTRCWNCKCSACKLF